MGDFMVDVITKLYEVKISCTDVNPSIDDTIEVTVKVMDFNGKILPNIALQLKVDKGYFTKYTRNGTDTSISGTSTKSYNGTTGTDGTFKLTYKASEWSLCTFSCDTEKLQVFVRGFRKINVTSTNGCDFWVDESIRACKLRWSCPSVSLHQTSQTFDTVTLPNNKYVANANVYGTTYRSDVCFLLQRNGKILGRTLAGVTSSSPRSMDAHNEYFIWHY